MMLIMLLALLSSSAFARDVGQWAQADPALRQWFREQRIPSGPLKGVFCCSEADGVQAEEDVRGGQYWARFKDQDWTQVPADAVIDGANKNGAPVVWWYIDKGETKIRCYSPGAKM